MRILAWVWPLIQVANIQGPEAWYTDVTWILALRSFKQNCWGEYCKVWLWPALGFAWQTVPHSEIIFWSLRLSFSNVLPLVMIATQKSLKALAEGKTLQEHIPEFSKSETMFVRSRHAFIWEAYWIPDPGVRAGREFSAWGPKETIDSKSICNTIVTVTECCSVFPFRLPLWP